MAPPFGFVFVEVGADLLGPRQHDRGEGLVDLERVDLVDASGRCAPAGAGWHRSGPVSMRTGSTPTRHVSTTRARGVRPSSLARDSVIISTAAAPSEICDELPAVWTPFSRATGFSVASFSSVDSRMPSSRCTTCGGAGGLALLVEVGCLDRDPLAVVAALGPRLGGPLLRCQAEGIGVLTRDAPLVGDALGALELRRHLVAAEVGLGDRHAEAELLRRVDADRDAAHDLDAARQGDVDDAGADQRGGQVRGLLARTALGVDGRGRRRQRAGRRPAMPCG